MADLCLPGCLAVLLEMAAESHKDNNLVEINASYSVVNSYPLCDWCSISTQ